MLPMRNSKVSRPPRAVREEVRHAGYWIEIEQRLAPYFERAEPRRRAMAYLRGLIGPTARKTSWQFAAAGGDSTPYGVQHLLRRARWNPDALRDELRGFILEHLRDSSPVLVINETCFHKKGHHSAGVARQASGTTGAVENCQLGVFLGYAGLHVLPLLDRELHLPAAWTDDRDRCRRAGIPDDRRFLTKPQLAQQMLARAFDAGVPATWVTGDRVYGDDRPLRLWLEAQPHAYVLAVSDEASVGPVERARRVDMFLATLPDDEWARLRAAKRSSRVGRNEWYWWPLANAMEPAWGHWLLVRRRAGDLQGSQAYAVFGPADSISGSVVYVSQRSETMAREMQAAHHQVGLGHYEVRSWTGWYRHITLAMWAWALLAAQEWGDDDGSR